MLLILLYPFVYYEFKESNVLLFDTLNKKIKCFQFYENIYIQNKTSFVVHDNLINRELAREISENHWGIVNEVVSNKTKLLEDSSTELDNYYNAFFSEKTDNKYVLKELIKKIKINLSNKIDLFFNVINEMKNEIMSTNIFFLVSNNLSHFKNLETIELNADYISLNNNSNGLRKLISKYHSVIINILFFDFQSNRKEILDICKDATINVLINNLSDVSLKDILNLKSSSQDISLKVLIKNTDDYSLLESWNLINDKHLKIAVNHNSCINDLNDLLSYSVDDIIEIPTTIRNLIHKEWINPLYWGDLFVDTNGNMLCNENQIIGHFFNFDDTQYNRLIEKDSLWRMTRNKHLYCYKCLFRNICPPLSEIELYNKRIFCKMILDKS